MDHFINFGVCPQFIPLWEELSPVDHIRFFSRIKGLSTSEVEINTNFFLRAMGLDEYKDTLAKNLSSGNKKKLAATIAMIGAPQCIFFDEPTSGVDIVSKRKLLIGINAFVKNNGSSILYTTNSLDEAEDICHKIGIHFQLLISTESDY